MESIIALRRINHKHWQARLSCSNCMPPCSNVIQVPVGPELELQLSSYDSDDHISKETSGLSRSDFPLEFLPSSSPRTEDKVDKASEVRSDNKFTVQQETSDTDIVQEQKEDKRASKDRRATKAEKPLKSERCAAKPEKCRANSEKPEKPPKAKKEKKETRPCSKTCPKELQKAEEKPASKACSKPCSKALALPSGAASKAESKVEIKEDSETICCTKSSDNKSTKSAKSEPDTSLAPSNTDSCFPPCLEKKKEMGKEDKKKKKEKPPKPPKSPKEPKPKLERKSSAKTQKTKPKPKEKDKKKKPHEKRKPFEPKKLKAYPTFTQIGGSVSHNCCSCLDAMALYIKEFLRFSCSLTTGRPAQDTEFQERVCDMLQILRTMCRDCFYIVRYVLRLLFVD